MQITIPADLICWLQFEYFVVKSNRLLDVILLLQSLKTQNACYQSNDNEF